VRGEGVARPCVAAACAGAEAGQIALLKGVDVHVAGAVVPEGAGQGVAAQDGDAGDALAR